jgi:hypothetical protein
MSRTARFLRDNALGLIAITIALSAGAYAVDRAPRDTVVSSSIRNGSVKGADVKDDSLTGEDINESTLALPSDAGGTVKSVTAGNALEGGTITDTGTISLKTCPATQILKSTGPDYACAADVDTDSDTDTTYAAGTGLQLSGGTFSIAPGGVGSAEITDGSINAADLGFVLSASFTATSLATGQCLLGVGSQTAQFAPGTPGDFTLVSSDPPVPTKFVLSGEVGPINGAFREYYFNVCNLSGGTASVPAITVRMLVIAN